MNETTVRVENVDLNVRRGEALGTLDRKGEGKATLLNILATLLLPDRATIEILEIKSISRNFSTLRSFLVNVLLSWNTFARALNLF